ncbi:MAG: ribonuclease R [Pseudomonadota bacterium]
MSDLPTKDQILAWIRENPAEASKREVARAFGVKGADRIPLKRLLRELETDGHIARDRKRLREPGTLPPVSVLRVSEPDSQGDLWAEPVEWTGEDPAPRISVQTRPHEPALGAGDRILARIAASEHPGAPATARLIRRIGTGPRRLTGIFRTTQAGARIQPIDRRSNREWRVPPGATAGAEDGELVEAEQAGPRDRLGLPAARITARLGDPSAPRAVSLIAIHTHDLPTDFPSQALAEAAAARPASLDTREDLRALPLITIDPADARDHDDAVCALPDPESGGHILWVAIADVAHYVRPGSALDAAARDRGNSTYFPDRVVPMLPEALSADLCSLHAGADRPCLAVEIRLAPDGTKTGHRFTRGLMRSAASLSYTQAQTAIDGTPDAAAAPLLDTVLRPLWAAYDALKTARDARAPLDLDLPERRMELAEDGTVAAVAFRARHDAHRLIEEAMILANVCAAETLENKRSALIYRIHEEPDPQKLEALRQTAEAAGLRLAKGQVITPAQLNALLAQAADRDDADLINLAVLRSMPQAVYSAQNVAHFGLGLRAYAHFTSPIRRYADLIVHRALIAAHGWGADGLTPAEMAVLDATADWISQTERRSMQAERDTVDRYLAAFLADRVGSTLSGRITGIARAGVFVRLDGSGADGLAPMSSLGAEYFHYDRQSQTLMGDRSGRRIALGQSATVKIAGTDAATGGVTLEILDIDGETLDRGTPSRRTRRPKSSARKGKRRRRN